MKRSIAAVLSLSVVLGLTGCTAKETRTERTTTESKTTTEPEDSTSESESTESETSDSETTESEASESTTESESSESTTESATETSESETSETTKESETSKATPTPAPQKKFTVSHDLTKPDMNRETRTDGIAALAKNANNQMAYVRKDMTVYTFQTPGFDKMHDLLDSIYDGRANMVDYLYSENTKNFSDNVDKYTSENIWSEGKTSIKSTQFITRADSQVFSFYFVDDFPSDDEDDAASYTYLNYDSETGAEIKLSDIITDRKAFAGAIKSNYTKPLTGSDWEIKDAERKNAAVESIAADIEKGQDLPFLLYHNAIQFKYIQKFDDWSDVYTFIFSVADLDKCVNMDYFGATTPYYTLPADHMGNVVWDFDEDGTPDKLSFTYTDKSLDFQINNMTTSIVINSDMYADDGYAIDNVMYTDSGFYINLTCFNEDPINGELIFRLKGEKVEFVGGGHDFAFFPFDPSDCHFMSRSDIMGTGHITIEGTCIGTDGKPTPTDPFYQKIDLGITTKKMVLGKYNEKGPFADDIETIKIPAGTAVMFLGIDSEHEMALLTTLNANPDDNELFYMACWRDKTNQWNEYDYEIRYNGETSYNLFTGPMYAD